MDEFLIRAGQAVEMSQSEALRVTRRASATAAAQDERSAPTAVGSSQQQRGSPLTPTADVASPREPNRRAQQATFLEHILLTNCLGEEEATINGPTAVGGNALESATAPEAVPANSTGTVGAASDAATARTSLANLPSGLRGVWWRCLVGLRRSSDVLANIRSFGSLRISFPQGRLCPRWRPTRTTSCTSTSSASYGRGHNA